MLRIIFDETTVFEAPESTIQKPYQASCSLTGRVISSFFSLFADSVPLGPLVVQVFFKSSHSFSWRLETHQGNLVTNDPHLSISNTFLARVWAKSL